MATITNEWQINGLPIAFYGQCVTALERLRFGGAVLVDDDGKPAPVDHNRKDEEYKLSGPAWFFYVHLFRFLNPELTPNRLECVLLNADGEMPVSDEDIGELIADANEVIRHLLTN